MALINLNKKLDNLDRTSMNMRRKPRNKKKLLTRVVVILLVIFVVLYLPARGVYSSLNKVTSSIREVSQSSKQEDLDQIKASLADVKKATDELNGSLNWFFWLRAIPYFGGYYSDAKHFASAASAELEAASVVVDSLDPYKQELGLTGQATAGQDRVAQAVKILEKTLPNLDKIEPSLKKARNEVESVDTGKYPDKIGGRVLRRRVEEAKNFIIGAHIAVSQNRSALEIAPDALGTNSPKTYLMLFQNDKELRATGGFMTAYAFLKLDKGHISTTTSDDIYRLDEKLLNVCKNKVCPLTPPAPIVKYLPEANGKPRTAWSMRDSNISPDWEVSAKQFESMYSLLGEGLPFDGIITIDTQVVEELIKITGPIDVYGTTYSGDIDKRCNCVNVIYELEHYAEIASKGEADRKAVLGTLMQQIMAKSLGSATDKLPSFINTGILLAGDKHIMFYMHDPKVQQAMEGLNWTGQIKPFGGDYLHINDSNFAGGKSNLYVEEKVEMDIKVDGSGKVTNKVTIDYKNPQPSNIWLNGILRDYIRVYVPRGSELVTSKGSDDPVNKLEDEVLNKTYFDGFIQVRPQNSRTLYFEYTLPNAVSGKNYSLLIQKQPGAKDHQYTIKINGNKKEEFKLTSDKQLNLSL